MASRWLPEQTARYLRGAGPVALGQAVGALAVLLLGVATARHLGPDGRGVFATTTFAAVLAGSGSLSIVPTVAYFDPKRLGVLAAIGAGIGLVGGAGAGAFLFLTDSPGSAGIAPFIPGLYALFVTPIALASGRFLGAGSTRSLGLLFGLGPLAQLGGVLVAMAIGADGAGGLLIGWTGGFAALALVVAVRIPRSGSILPSSGQLVRYSLAAASTNVLWALGARVELFVLAGLATAGEVGVYSVALAPAQVLTVLASAYAAAIYPALRGGGRAILSDALDHARRLAGLALLVAGVFAVALPTLIPLVYGDAFDSSVGPGLILLGAGVVLAPVAVLNAYLNNALGRPGLTSALAGAGLAVTIVLAVLLVPSSGAEGAASASLVGSLTLVGAGGLIVRSARAAATQGDQDQDYARNAEYGRPQP